MRAGRLRRVVAIETPTFARGATGASKTASWAAIANGASVYADIDESSGKEQIQAGQVNPQRPVTITVRYLAGVTAECRVTYVTSSGTRTFQIVSFVNLDQRNRVLVLTCLEKSP